MSEATKCGARKKSGKGTCTLTAGYGTTHLGFGNCKFHAGSTKAGIAYAARLKMEVDVVTYGGAIIVSPADALLQEVYRSAGHVHWLGQVIELARSDGLTEKTIGGEQFNAWVRQYEREREMLRRAAESAIKAGVAEAQIRLAEAQARTLAAVIQAIFEDPELAHTPAQRYAFPTVARRHLEALPVQTESERPGA